MREIYRSDVVFQTLKDWARLAASRWSAPEPSQRTRREDHALLIVRDEFPSWLFLGGLLSSVGPYEFMDKTRKELSAIMDRRGPRQ